MENKDQSKEAFPLFAYVDKDDHSFQSGMTLREYYAGLALQGMLANQKLYKIAADKILPDDMAHFYALCATEHADALLAQLNKKEE